MVAVFGFPDAEGVRQAGQCLSVPAANFCRMDAEHLSDLGG